MTFRVSALLVPLLALVLTACGAKKPTSTAAVNGTPFTVMITLLEQDNGHRDQILCQVFVADVEPGQEVMQPDEKYTLMSVFEGETKRIIIPPTSLIFSTDAKIGVRCAHNETGENLLFNPRETPQGPVTTATGLLYEFDNTRPDDDKYFMTVLTD